jgi:hypothetical protein
VSPSYYEFRALGLWLQQVACASYAGGAPVAGFFEDLRFFGARAVMLGEEPHTDERGWALLTMIEDAGLVTFTEDGLAHVPSDAARRDVEAFIAEWHASTSLAIAEWYEKNGPRK